MPYLLKINLRKDPFTRQAQDLLKGWNFRTGAKSAPAAYYNAVWSNILRLTFDDELSGDLEADGRRSLVRGRGQPADQTRATPGGTTRRLPG